MELPSLDKEGLGVVGKEQGGVRGGWNYLLDLRYYSYYILLTSRPSPPPSKEGGGDHAAQASPKSLLVSSFISVRIISEHNERCY